MKNIAGKLAVTAVTTGVVLGASVGMNTTTVLARKQMATRYGRGERPGTGDRGTVSTRDRKKMR